jgi:hypothetical protein
MLGGDCPFELIAEKPAARRKSGAFANAAARHHERDEERGAAV